jgi:hypothetical protein
MRKIWLLLPALVLTGCGALNIGTAKAVSGWQGSDPNTYYAVLLTNGSVYFGKLEGYGTSDYPILRDVFYVQSGMNQQTKEVSNVLLKRGAEWHSPNQMVLQKQHIVLVEPVGANSQVAQLIAKARQ